MSKSIEELIKDHHALTDEAAYYVNMACDRSAHDDPAGFARFIAESQVAMAKAAGVAAEISFACVKLQIYNAREQSRDSGALLQAAVAIDNRVVEASKALPDGRDIFNSGGDITIPASLLRDLRSAIVK